MKFLQMLALSSFLVGSLQASPLSKKGSDQTPPQCSMGVCCCQKTHAVKPIFGSAGFSGGPTDWFTIETNSYPDVTPLSLNRNRGFKEGRLYLSPTGVTVGEDGNYWVDVVAILQNPTPDTTFLVPVYLVRDEVFDPADPNPMGGVVTLQPDIINTMNGSGILKNVSAGTRLSLVATNSGHPDPLPVTVVAWAITLYKLP